MAQRNRSDVEQVRQTPASLSLEYPNAAGIDVGSRSHFVAVPSDRDERAVRAYG